VLTQSGIIDQGPDVHTYFSAISVAASGDLGLTFMESSATEPISMYITGQPAADYGTGTMLPPVAVAVGQGNYSGGRGGDYAGMTLDPLTDNVFWAANEYKAAGASSLWGTRMARFVLDANSELATARDAWRPFTGQSSGLLNSQPAPWSTPVVGLMVPVSNMQMARVDSAPPSPGPEMSKLVRISLRLPPQSGADEWSAIVDRDELAADTPFLEFSV
jgi:hypothetical protein